MSTIVIFRPVHVNKNLDYILLISDLYFTPLRFVFDHDRARAAFGSLVSTLSIMMNQIWSLDPCMPIIPWGLVVHLYIIDTHTHSHMHCTHLNYTILGLHSTRCPGFMHDALVQEVIKKKKFVGSSTEPECQRATRSALGDGN